MKHNILPVLAVSLLVAVSGAAKAQCNGTEQGTSGNPYPLVIGTEADCAVNSSPVPAAGPAHQSNVLPLGCGATQQRDMWFAFTANTAETVIRLYNSNSADVGFMVYGGPCGSTMDLVACAGYDQPNNSTVIAAIIPTVPGSRYHARVSRRGFNALPTALRICGWDVVRVPDLLACGDNVSFENGTTDGWTCRYGHYELRMVFPHAGCLNPNGPNAPLVPWLGAVQAWDAGDRHTIMSDRSYLDPRTNYDLLAVAPGGGGHSFRLGDNGHGCGAAGGPPPCHAQAASLSLTRQVAPENAEFQFMFAAVIPYVAHPPEESPRFEVLVTDENGDTIPCGHLLFTSGGGLAEFKPGQGNWSYTDWTDAALDLTAYIGRTVTIDFRVADCFPRSGTGLACSCSGGVCVSYPQDLSTGQYYRCESVECLVPVTSPDCVPIRPEDHLYHAGNHSAYAYIDTYCRPQGPGGQDQLDGIVFCRNADSIVVCAPRGYRNYNWPAGQPGLTGPLDQRCVTILNPMDGQGYTAHMEMLTGCPATRTASLRMDPTCTVGMEEPRPLPRLELFPNPAGDRLTFKLGPNVRVELFRVMDAQGRVVMERTGGPQRELDVAGIAPGVYTVRVDTDRGRMTGRFVKE